MESWLWFRYKLDDTSITSYVPHQSSMLDHFPFNAKQAHCFGGFNGVADGFWAARERERAKERTALPLFH